MTMRLLAEASQAYESAREAFQTLNADWIVLLLETLKTQVEETDHADLAQEAQKSIDQVRSEPDKAQEIYSDFKKKYDEEMAPSPNLQPETTILGSDTGAVIREILSPILAAPRIASPPEKVDLPTWASIKRRIYYNDLIAFAIVTLLSVLIGLQILWAPENDFGSLVDYVTVFLWGFGLHAMNSIAQPAALKDFGLAWRPGGSTKSTGSSESD